MSIRSHFPISTIPNHLAPALSSEDRNADIVVVGGGPVGLWTAIQARVLTQKRVVVLEKHEEYQRADIGLNLDASSLDGVPEDRGLKELIAGWKKRKVVPIKEMEQGLSSRASELGIRIIRGYTANPEELAQQFSQAKVFIGADGAKSEVRRQIFEDQFRFNTTLQHIVQVQYVTRETEKEGNSKLAVIKNLAETYSMQKFAKHIISQTIRPQEDGSSKVTLQIFVDKDTYDKMSDATFKHPYYIEKDLDKLPDSLAEALKKWWGWQELSHKRLIEPSTLNKITVIALGSYASQEIVKVQQGRVWALVGDAAAAFPFFRAINNGLLCGTALAQSISQAFQKYAQDPIQEFPVAPFRSYTWYATWRAYVERIKAFFKNLFIELSKLWLEWTTRVPECCHSIQHSPADKLRIMELGNATWKRLTGQIGCYTETT